MLRHITNAAIFLMICLTLSIFNYTHASSRIEDLIPPFPPGEKWTIVQGYKSTGGGSHSTANGGHFSLDLVKEDSQEQTKGAIVTAMADGVVTAIKGCNQNGCNIDLKLDDGYLIRYSHIQNLAFVTPETRVSKGQNIAKVVTTPAGGVVHLDIAIWGKGHIPFNGLGLPDNNSYTSCKYLIGISSIHCGKVIENKIVLKSSSVAAKRHADFDGDGLTDTIIINSSGSYWYFSDGTARTWKQLYSRNDLKLGSVDYTFADFDGDNRSDMIVTDPSGSYWLLSRCTSRSCKWEEVYRRTDLSLANTKFVVGNFNGTDSDKRRRDDVILVNSSGSFWYISTKAENNRWSFNQPYARNDLKLNLVKYIL